MVEIVEDFGWWQKSTKGWVLYTFSKQLKSRTEDKNDEIYPATVVAVSQNNLLLDSLLVLTVECFFDQSRPSISHEAVLQITRTFEKRMPFTRSSKYKMAGSVGPKGD